MSKHPAWDFWMLEEFDQGRFVEIDYEKSSTTGTSGTENIT